MRYGVAKKWQTRYAAVKPDAKGRFASDSRNDALLVVAQCEQSKRRSAEQEAFCNCRLLFWHFGWVQNAALFLKRHLLRGA